MTSHYTTLALELSISPERRTAYSVMVHRIREAMRKGGLTASATIAETGYRVEPAMDDPDDRLVVTWYDPGLEAENAESRSRQRRVLEYALWLIVDEVDDISGAHLQGWGDPFVVVNYSNFQG